MDVWDNIVSQSYATRSAVIGMSSIGGICSGTRYSIIEYSGLNSIQNAAHEIGHK